jgi:hypothetical protein
MKQYSPGDNIYQTAGDDRFNSFSSDVSGYNQMNNGQWGINPNLMTPAYNAAYRPDYNGTQSSPYSHSRPGFLQSANQVLNPFSRGGNNYGGSGYQQNSPYYDTLGYNPLDHGASIAQRVVPFVGSWISYKYLARPLGNMGERLGAGMVGGVAGKAFSPGTTALLGSVGGGLGRMAFEGASGLIGAEIATWAADKAVFDPYVAQRQMSDTLRKNFAGISFSDGTGNAVTGRGLSRESSSHIAQQLSIAGAKDATFNQSEMSNMTDLSARAGLLDNVQGGQITDRMKTIMRQMKTVMAVAGTSDFKETIEMISKVQSMGVSVHQSGAAITGLSGMASIAGVSLQKMMNTVGSQGAYMYGANNMSPIVGMQMAATSLAGFSAAQRAGVLSPAMLARMGGVEGATQSAVSGGLTMSQTPYSRMAAMNMYLNGQGKQGIIGNLSTFGGNMASDPLHQIGVFNMLSPELASASMSAEGNRGQLEHIRDQMRIMDPQHLGAKGGMDPAVAYQHLVDSGSSPAEARAMVLGQISNEDPKVKALKLAGLATTSEEARMNFLRQHGLNRGILTGVSRDIDEFFGGIQANSADGIGRVLRNVSGTASGVEKWFTTTSNGENQNPLMGVSDAVTLDEGRLPSKFRNGPGRDTSLTGAGDLHDAISDINNPILKNSDIAQLVQQIQVAGPEDKKRLTAILKDKIQRRALGDNGRLSKKFTKGKAVDDLVEVLSQNKVTVTKGKSAKTLQEITETSSEGQANSLYELAEKFLASGGDVESEESTKLLKDFQELTNNKSATMEDMLTKFTKIGVNMSGIDKRAADALLGDVNKKHTLEALQGGTHQYALFKARRETGKDSADAPLMDKELSEALLNSLQKLDTIKTGYMDVTTMVVGKIESGKAGIPQTGYVAETNTGKSHGH